MIGYLRGTPTVIGDTLLVTTQGVGYQVFVSSRLLSIVSNKDQIELYIYTHVREDRIHLFGFESMQDKELFELVLTVSGIGPSTALNMIAAGGTALIKAVQNADVPFFTKINRVGKKLAKKTILELSGKLGEMTALELSGGSKLETEVVESLTQLGLDEQYVVEKLRDIDLEKVGVETAIADILKSARKQ